jgi:hypothetical protein
MWDGGYHASPFGSWTFLLVGAPPWPRPALRRSFFRAGAWASSAPASHVGVVATDHLADVPGLALVGLPLTGRDEVAQTALYVESPRV